MMETQLECADELVICEIIAYQQSPIRNRQPAIQNQRADDGVRTRDLRFTKPLLYRLSYVGANGRTLHPHALQTSAATTPLLQGQHKGLADFA